MDATASFLALVHRPERDIRLDEAALLVAAHADRSLDLDAALRRLDELAAGVTEPGLDGICRHLFGELGFRGADHDYDDPRNSYLHVVVERRTGIPITLVILLAEVGRRLGVPLACVSMPGHFLARDGSDPEVFIDPFARGARLDAAGARARFQQVHGTAAPFEAAFLEPVGPRSTLARVLANLERIFTRTGDRASLRWVLELRAGMPEAGVGERGRLAALLASGGQLVEAATLLERIAVDVEGSEADAALAAAQRLRATLN
ncbi:MAG: transglutaminase-like domain-containing protein [Actinomycetota bacterium]|nr:transglutaminase-like domain-containing protein [Actinomycetota bacterium]